MINNECCLTCIEWSGCNSNLDWAYCNVLHKDTYRIDWCHEFRRYNKV